MVRFKKVQEKNELKIINTGCCHDCGGRCVLRAHIKNGKIIRLETDNGEKPQLRACLRGRAYRQRVYSDERLKYPLRRVGERGEGIFERISWDEALDGVAYKIKEIKSRTPAKLGNFFLSSPSVGEKKLFLKETAALIS